MPAVIDERTQYVDIAGKPIVDGDAYFGVQNADPKVSPITIYSDRSLSIVIANPQPLDGDGRTINKVWVSGRYSIRVDDLNGALKYQELDNGESADKGVTALENVSGGNTIIATAASTITAYEDLEQYTFRTAQINTGPVTLNIDTVGEKDVVKNHDQPILPDEFEADQNVVVSYNLTDDVFEWVNQNAKAVAFYQGTDVATATQPDIWVTDGNTFHFTGTVTVVDLADAPAIGARRTGIADGAFTLTHGSGITLEGSANIDIAVGDRIEFLADAVDEFSAWVTRADGQAVIPPVLILVATPGSIQTGVFASGPTTTPPDNSIPQITETNEFMSLAYTPDDAANILEITMTGVHYVSSSGGFLTAALFKVGTADALATAQFSTLSSSVPQAITFKHRMVAGTASEITFKYGAGASSGTTYFNGNSTTGALMGGTFASSMTVKEFTP